MALSFTSWSFDAVSYAPGATVTLTVGYTSTDVADASDVANAVTVTLADAASGSVSQSSDDSGNFPSFNVATPGTGAEPVTVSAVGGANPWTVVSNDLTGDASPFTGSAVLTSVA